VLVCPCVGAYACVYARARVTQIPLTICQMVFAIHKIPLKMPVWRCIKAPLYNENSLWREHAVPDSILLLMVCHLDQ